MALDINKLTLQEIDTIESLSGLSISAIADDASPKGRVLAALAYTAKHKIDPTYTWNDAFALTIQEAQDITGLGGDDADPKEEVALPEPVEEVPATPSKKTPAKS